MQISSAARILALESLDKVSVGTPFEYFVESNVEPIVEILGPARRIVPATVEEAPERNGYRVEFTATEVGDHSVEVRTGT